MPQDRTFYKGEYWCADFTKWAWHQAGINTSGLDSGVASWRHTSANNYVWHPLGDGYAPQPGDAIIWKQMGKDSSGKTILINEHAHISLVDTVASPTSITTIGGDVGGDSRGGHYFWQSSFVRKDGPFNPTTVNYGGQIVGGYTHPLGGSTPQPPPALTVAVSGINPNQNVNGPVTFTVKLNQAISGVYYHIQNQAGADVNVSPELFGGKGYPYTVNFSQLPNGQYKVYANAMTGNATIGYTATPSPTIVFNVLNTPAPPTLAAPTGAVSGPVTLSATDAGYPVDHMQFWVSGVLVGTSNAGPNFSVPWDTRTATDGPYTVTAIAFTSAGNASAPAVGSPLTVANTPPTAFITNVADGQVLSGSVTLDASVSSPDGTTVTSVSYFVDGNPLDPKNPAATTLDTSVLTDGPHQLTASVTDSASPAVSGQSSPLSFIVTSDKGAQSVQADFNGDGRQDIAVLYDESMVDPSAPWSASVRIFYGQADGTFSGPVTAWDSGGAYTFDAAAAKMLVGDFNGDGKTDIAFMYNESMVDPSQPWHTSIRLLPGNGNGTFGPLTTAWDSGGPNTFAWEAAQPVVGDFEHTGRTDIAVLYDEGLVDPSAPWGATIRLFSGQSNNTFTGPVTAWDSGGAYTFDAAAAKMVPGDFNGDGKTDIAFLYNESMVDPSMPWAMSIRLLPGNGDGTFAPLTTAWDSGGAWTFSWDAAKPIAADFDRDGRTDIAVLYDEGLVDPSTPWGATIRLFSGQANNTFSGPVTAWDSGGAYTFDAAAAKMVARDFNGDGKPDIAFLYDESMVDPSTPWAASIRMLTGNGDGTFAPMTTAWDSGGPNTFAWEAAKLG